MTKEPQKNRSKFDKNLPQAKTTKVIFRFLLKDNMNGTKICIPASEFI